MKQIYILLIALLMGLSANAEKSGFCGPDLRWHLTDNGVLTISGKGKMYDYSFDNEAPWGRFDTNRIIIGDGITTIGGRAFANCICLTSVTIPNSVTEIGGSAFFSCSSLTSVTIPNSVTTIGEDAFKYCRLTSVTIPNSVTTIGEDAFSNCSELTSVTIPNSVTTIGKYAFSNCSSLTSVTIPNSVTEIGGGAFYNCSALTSVTIPNSVTTIGGSAFKGCSSLTSVTIPNSVTTIGEDAFRKCSSLNSVTIPNSVTTIGEDAFIGIAKIIWLTNTPPAGYRDVGGRIHYVANNLYTGLFNKKVYPYLSSIFEVNGVKYVPISPSERTCDALDCIYTGDPYEVKINKKVNYKGIDMTVREINPYTAYGCANIKKAYIDTNGSIGDNAFSNCTNLVSVDIKAANNIGNGAFSGCSSLKTLSLDNKIKSLGQSAFAGCSNLKQFVIPDSVTILNDDLLSACFSLKSIRIHKNIQEIDDEAFYGCTNLSTLIIEDRNTTLKLVSFSSRLFADCKLDSVYIGGEIVYNTSSDYGYSPFYRNTSLRTVKISDVKNTIYDNEFYGCTNLQNVSIGDNVRSIGKWAFSACSGLKNFTFGRGLRVIGQEAFSGCINITKITSEADAIPTCGINALDDINKRNCKLFVPKASIDAYKQAPQWKEFFFIHGTTGITNTVYNNSGLADVYTIDGTKRLSKASTDEINALPKGVYIVNGKKIIIK